MEYTQKQKEFVIGQLINFGWLRENNIITAPSGGIWFEDSHFNDWEPQQMKEIIKNRGNRVAREKHQGWEEFSEEHFQLCKTIDALNLN